MPIATREDSFRERALQIFNLKYPLESDIKSSYKRRVFEYHPDRHPETIDDPDKLREYEKKIKVINQSYKLLLDSLDGVQIDLNKYCLLEETALVQSLLPENVNPVPLGKTEQELWIEKWGNTV